MATKKINELSEVINSNDDDLLLMQTSDGTRKITKKNLLKDTANKLDYDEERNMLQLKSNDNVLSEIGITSGGGGGIKLLQPTDINIVNTDEGCNITWKDPDDIIIEGITLAKWSGTLVVRKAGSAPTSKSDGVVIANVKERDFYLTTPLEDANLTNEAVYYYGIFPYTEDDVYTTSCVTEFIPHAIYLEASEITLSNGILSASGTYTNVEGATKYVLTYKAGSAPTSHTDGTYIELSDNTWSVNGLTRGVAYYFSVFAGNAKERYTASNVESVVTTQPKITVTVDDEFIGQSITCVHDNETITIDSAQSENEIYVNYLGRYVITCNGKEKEINVTEYNGVYNVTINSFKIVSWTNGTDEEIAAMLEAHYAGDINISDYWSVGDIRKVELGYMAATGVGESHYAQKVELVIIDFDHDNLTRGGKAAVTIQQRDCLSEIGYMEGSSTNAKGWVNCARRTWCNNTYKNALPTALADLIKEVTKRTSAGNKSSTIMASFDNVFLISEVEAFGQVTGSYAGEGTQYEHYKSTSNRYKYKGTSRATNTHWLLRSPRSNDTYCYCAVGSGGNTYATQSDGAMGIAPAFCI